MDVWVLKGQASLPHTSTTRFTQAPSTYVVVARILKKLHEPRGDAAVRFRGQTTALWLHRKLHLDASVARSRSIYKVTQASFWSVQWLKARVAAARKPSPCCSRQLDLWSFHVSDSIHTSSSTIAFTVIIRQLVLSIESRPLAHEESCSLGPANECQNSIERVERKRHYQCTRGPRQNLGFARDTCLLSLGVSARIRIQEQDRDPPPGTLSFEISN